MLRPLSLLLLFWTVLAPAEPVLAHRVNLFARLDSGAIVGEAYFSGGGKPKDVSVVLTDASGTVLATARTDEAGRFRFDAPKAPKAPLVLSVNVGDGHLGDYTLTARDLGVVEAPKVAPQAPAEPVSAPPSTALAPACPEILARLDELSERMRSQQAQLTRLAEAAGAVGVKDVVGGLGWVLGIFGALALAKGRR